MNTKNNVRKAALVVALSAAGMSLLSTNLHASDSKDPVQKTELTPLVVLSEKVGDVAREAIGSGVVATQKAMDNYPGMMLLYADVDTISSDRYQAVIDSIRQALNRGTMVVLETSEFKFEKLRDFVSLNFPEIDSAGIDDVAFLLRQDGHAIRAERIDPSELAMYAGIPYANTTAGKYSKLVVNEESSNKALPSHIKYTLRFAAKAYESNPTDDFWDLKRNGTYVDVWKQKNSSTHCLVAWRGTVTTHLPDVHADLSSQFSWTNTDIYNERGVTLKGGKGFVQRLHANDDTVLARLELEGCTKVSITGHSLGGAVASIHALQLAHNRTWRSRLRDFVAYNSPNVVDDQTRRTPVATLRSYAQSFHVLCRLYDWLVNPLPTGLHRIGDFNSTPVGSCTFVKTGTTWSADPRTNHELSLWEAEF